MRHFPGSFRTNKSYPPEETWCTLTSRRLPCTLTSRRLPAPLRTPFGQTRCTLTSRRLSIGLNYLFHVCVISQAPFGRTRCTLTSRRLPCTLTNRRLPHFQDITPDGWKDGWKDGWTTPKLFPSEDGG
ncbi:hypothetical protein DPMN_087415 [Dreissena polymorpha]|uniref:Uncharacterized protein n=1 Tax=Dreissena polymorpha TaxID=45954 RepID=A0A9D4KTV2_DREPO|nr:hypothetical protein DPMN_087415 [Dreissena polymorpha]